MKEFELIRWIADQTPAGEGLVSGIGDDCAVLELPGREIIVVTTDMLIEGTHFRCDDTPEDIGYKAIAVSISDVAAMGCRSLHAFLAAGLPAGFSESFAKGLLRGALKAAGRFGVSLAGGDTTASPGGLSICSTLIGAPPAGLNPVLRSGATAGQSVLVTGRLGGSLGGRHLRFVPRQKEALDLVARCPVGAMIDLSDGLSSDARHVAQLSSVRLRLDRERIPVSEDVRAKDPVLAALNDGEDFELLFTTATPDALDLQRTGLAGTPVTIIGEVISGTPGVTLVGPGGDETELAAGGYEHFAR